MDPDPPSFSLLDPDPKLKECKEIGNNCNFIKICKVNFDQLHGFLLLSNLVCLYQLQKTVCKIIFYKFVKAGSGPGSALKNSSWIQIPIEKKAGSVSTKIECGSTALDKREFFFKPNLRL